MDEEAMNLGSRTKIRGNSHLNRGPRTLELGKWRAREKFDAYTQRHPVTESSYNNSLADCHIWSTIKTLPATLPEPRTVVRGPRSEFHGPLSSSHGSSAGVTAALSYFRMTLAEGVGPRLGWALRLGPRSFDGLAKAMRCKFIL